MLVYLMRGGEERGFDGHDHCFDAGLPSRRFALLTDLTVEGSWIIPDEEKPAAR